MLRTLQVALYVVAVVLFWLLAFRVAAVALRLDPYRPAVQWLLRVTEPLVRPFRRRIARTSPRLEYAALPPMLLLLLIIVLIGLKTWLGR